MKKMEKRFWEIRFILLMLMAFGMCLIATWFVSINTIVKILLTIAYSFILLFAGIDFYHMIESTDTKAEDMIKEDKIISYHSNSGLRNLTICLCVLCILLAYEAFLFSMMIWVVIFILLSILLLVCAIYAHVKAMKDVNVFNTDD